MLKIFQARLQQYVNRELPGVQAGFRKSRGTRQRSNCQHALDHRKSREFQKNIYFCFIGYANAFDCVDHNKLCKILKEMGIPDHLTCLLRNLYAGNKQPLELDMEQQTGSKLGKEYSKAIYCCPAYLTYMWCSVQFSCSVVSDSFWPHESQHARPPCPSPSPGVHSDSCPSSQWCHPALECDRISIRVVKGNTVIQKAKCSFCIYYTNYI